MSRYNIFHCPSDNDGRGIWCICVDQPDGTLLGVCDCFDRHTADILKEALDLRDDLKGGKSMKPFPPGGRSHKSGGPRAKSEFKDYSTHEKTDDDDDRKPNKMEEMAKRYPVVEREDGKPVVVQVSDDEYEVSDEWLRELYK